MVAASEGLTVKRLTTQTHRGRMGFCEVSKPDGWVMGSMGSYVPPDIGDPNAFQVVKGMISTALAGLMTHTAHDIAPGDQDLRHLIAMLHELQLVDHDHELLYLSRLAEQTRSRVDQHRDAIHAVAVELTWRKTISGERLRQIMAEHPPVPRPPKARPKPSLDWAGLFAELTAQHTGVRVEPVRRRKVPSVQLLFRTDRPLAIEPP